LGKWWNLTGRAGYRVQGTGFSAARVGPLGGVVLVLGPMFTIEDAEDKEG
jgi:hypothetical protein